MEFPQRQTLDGRYCRLEPLDSRVHGDSLFAASCIDAESEKRHLYLLDKFIDDRDEFNKWMEIKQSSTDPLMFVVIDKATGAVEGRQCFMRIFVEHKNIEIGNILWGPRMAKTRVATEAFYLFARHAFEVLGCQRFEWKCNNKNEASKKAAIRFGFQFEGIFRKHMIVNGNVRDTAWFSIIDDDWPAIKEEFERWLDPSNFESNGNQKTKLTTRVC